MKYDGLPSLSRGRLSLTTMYSRPPPTMPISAVFPAPPISIKVAVIAPKKAELAENALKWCFLVVLLGRESMIMCSRIGMNNNMPLMILGPVNSTKINPTTKK